MENKLRAEATQVRKDIRETFGVKLESSSSTLGELDDIVEEMWKTGWDPREGDLNLFTRVFGLLLFEATLDLLEGRPIFRSPNGEVYVHNSIYWPGVEAFPFHKAFKCLTEHEGETMAYFARGVGGQLEEKGLLKPEMKERLPKARHSLKRI